MRWVLLVAAALAGVLLFLLTSASANTALFAGQYRLLLGFTAAVAATLLGLVLWQLRQLWREHRAEVFGSRLKLRLMLVFALMAVVPGVLVYAVSLQFAVKSIESWFDVRVDKALEGGLNLGATRSTTCSPTSRRRHAAWRSSWPTRRAPRARRS